MNAITPSSIRILHGDCRDVLQTLSDQSVQCCVTSPPYYGLRDYGVDGQIGLEQTPADYVAELVAVFAEVRRVLRNNGTVWLNLGDSYNAGRDGGHPGGKAQWKPEQKKYANRSGANVKGLKPKDLLGIPWRVAFALQADGWWLRSAIVWSKPNPMPESVTDRPTSSYEMVFMLSKSATYFYDADAVKEPAVAGHPSGNGFKRDARLTYTDANGARGNDQQWTDVGGLRNVRNVWTIASRPFSGAHFATMPPDLAERCIKAASKPGDTVLDPFGGAGTTGLVADRLGRYAVLIELNPEYARLATGRIVGDCPLFASVT